MGSLNPRRPPKCRRGAWQIVNGALKFKSGRWDWWDFLVLKDFEFTDGTIQYKLKWIEGEHCKVGVFYRLVEESPDLPHYHVHVSAEIFPRKKPSGVVGGYVEKVVDRVKDEIAEVKWPTWHNAQIPGWERAPVDKWFEFKIEVSGEKHVVYAGLEGKLERAIEFRHDGPRSGKIGLVNLNGVDTVLIDDFEVIPGAVAVDKRSKLTTIWGKIKGNQ